MLYAYTQSVTTSQNILKMIMVQGDFLAVFHLPSKCHMFAGIGRAGGSARSARRHCQLGVHALGFH